MARDKPTDPQPRVKVKIDETYGVGRAWWHPNKIPSSSRKPMIDQTPAHTTPLYVILSTYFDFRFIWIILNILLKFSFYHMGLKRESDDTVEDLFIFLIKEVNPIPVVD